MPNYFLIVIYITFPIDHSEHFKITKNFLKGGSKSVKKVCHIKTLSKHISSSNNSLANQGINHVGQPFNENGMINAWSDNKIQFE